MTAETINELFEYRDGKLIGKVDRGFNKTKGREAGSIAFDGHMVVSIKYKRYYVHRLIWILHNGPIPAGMEIDHRDGNPINNRIDNLRLLIKARTVAIEAGTRIISQATKVLCFIKHIINGLLRLKLIERGSH